MTGRRPMTDEEVDAVKYGEADPITGHPYDQPEGGDCDGTQDWNELASREAAEAPGDLADLFNDAAETVDATCKLIDSLRTEVRELREAMRGLLAEVDRHRGEDLTEAQFEKCGKLAHVGERARALLARVPR